MASGFLALAVARELSRGSPDAGATGQLQNRCRTDLCITCILLFKGAFGKYVCRAKFQTSMAQRSRVRPSRRPDGVARARRALLGVNGETLGWTRPANQPDTTRPHGASGGSFPLLEKLLWGRRNQCCGCISQLESEILL